MVGLVPRSPLGALAELLTIIANRFGVASQKCYQKTPSNSKLGGFMDEKTGGACNANEHRSFNPFNFRLHSRREFLMVGMIGGLGLTLPQYLRAQTGVGPGLAHRDPAAKSVIQIFLPGGMSAQETFDPKPYAPSEYRGPFGTVKTAIPGVAFGEMMQRTAKIADRLCVIRSLNHREAAHERGKHTMLTGYRPSPALQYPSMGSVVSHELGSRNNLPAYICVPRQHDEAAGSGYLSSAYGPFAVGGEPEKKDFSVRDLSLPKGVDGARFDRRRSLLDAVDAHFRSLESSDALDAMDSFYHEAYSLISSKEAREAFDIKAEPGKLRDRYGRNRTGQRLLLARRLVEGGARFVSLTAGGWDHHADIKGGIENNVPELDQGFSALITDLEERGLLESTLVVLTTEFGRTPKINKDGGRDHWSSVFSSVLAGGGVRGGVAYGTTDAFATAPDEDPVSAEDFAATIYDRLGIVSDKQLMAAGGRPIEIVKGGAVVSNILT